MKNKLELITESEFDLDSSDNDFDMWGMLWRRKWIVAASTTLSLILGCLYFLQAQPVYQSTARVLIERKQPAIPIGTAQESAWTARQYFLADALKHPIILQSPQIIVSAYEERKLNQLVSLKESEYPLQTILENLKVGAEIEGLGVYNISFDGTNKQDTAKVVKAIIDTYRDFLQATHHTVGLETRDLIVRGKDELARALTKKEQAYNEFRRNAPLMWKDGTGMNLHQERQAAIETQRSVILLKKSELESRLDSVQSAIRRHENLDAILSMAAQALPDFERPFVKIVHPVDRRREAVIREQATLLPLVLQEEEFVSRYGNDHPRVKSVRRRIKHTREYLTKITETEEAIANEPLDPRQEALSRQWKRDLIRGYVAMLRQDLEQSQEAVDKLNELFKNEAELAKDLAVHQIQDEVHRNDIARTQQLFDRLLKSLDEIKLVENSAGYNFSVLAPAGPGMKIAPSIPKVFAISSILGMIVGAGLGYLVELTDKSFRSPVEISQSLHLPVVGNVPIMVADESVVADVNHGLDPVLCTVHQPRTHASEAYRTVRTAIYFNARSEKHQVIQITSPRPGDGKSTLAANLAITIAQSGKSTLLLDADFRRPTQHRLFGFSESVGLATVVDGRAEPADAYHTISSVENLTVIACGPRPENPSELLSSLQFQSTLAYLREQFDFVIVDTPPLLAVSDPRAVAAQVDGVLLTMRIDKEARPVATRAREILVETGANIIGVVVNCVGYREGGRYYKYRTEGYGYAANRYGYGYGHSYGYGNDCVDDFVESTAQIEQAGGNGKPETAEECRESLVKSPESKD
jgi:capsular exopolysaccharide synthesis family protein